jgi:peptidyl-prolyl cis-trans isomerase D
MLDGLRNFAKSTPGKIFGVVLLVGVAGFGINNVFFDLGNSTVARVGDEEISSLEFRRAYQSALSNFSQQFGSVPTAEQATAFGIPGSVLESMAREAALDDLGRRLGLGVSDQRLAVMVRQDPNFGGTLGTFDPQRFTQVLRFSGLTEAEYFANQGRIAGREQLSASLFGSPVLNDTSAALLAGYIGDTRIIDYLVVNPISVPSPAEPTEEELAAYLAENQAEFRTLETRSIDLLVLTPETIAAGIEISDEDIAARYEQTSASLTVPERRAIQQVLLTPEQEATFTAGQAEGRGFEELAAEAGLTPSQIGTRARAELTDANLAETAFGLEPGTFAVIDGVAGRRAVYVSAVEPGGTPALEEVSEQIATELAAAEARRRYAEILDQVEELRAAFRPLDEIAERFEIPLESIDLTASGIELEAVPALPAEARQRVTNAVFAAQEGVLVPAISLAGTSNVFFELGAIAPARDQTLDEIRDAVAAAWTADATQAAVSDYAARIVERLEAGENLADVALETSQFTQLSQPFTRQGETGTPIDATVASAVFAGGPDHAGSAVNDAGEYIVFEVTTVTPAGEDGLDPAIRQALAADAQRNLLEEFILSVRTAAGLRVNQGALQQALTLVSGQQL